MDRWHLAGSHPSIYESGIDPQITTTPRTVPISSVSSKNQKARPRSYKASRLLPESDY
jgi:hypothetical protein